MKLHCEGYSDDTFMIEGVGAPDRPEISHDNCASGKPIVFRVKAGGESLIVSGQYCPGEASGWLIGVSPDGNPDETFIPQWPMHFERGERAYSPRLVIEAPDNVKLYRVGKKRDEED